MHSAPVAGGACFILVSLVGGRVGVELTLPKQHLLPLDPLCGVVCKMDTNLGEAML